MKHVPRSICTRRLFSLRFVRPLVRMSILNQSSQVKPENIGWNAIMTVYDEILSLHPPTPSKPISKVEEGVD